MNFSFIQNEKPKQLLKPLRYNPKCTLCGNAILLQQYYVKILAKKKDKCEFSGIEITRVIVVNVHDDCTPRREEK